LNKTKVLKLISQTKDNKTIQYIIRNINQKDLYIVLQYADIKDRLRFLYNFSKNMKHDFKTFYNNFSVIEINNSFNKLLKLYNEMFKTGNIRKIQIIS
jgi:flagellar motor switch protein FliG